MDPCVWSLVESYSVNTRRSILGLGRVFQSKATLAHPSHSHIIYKDWPVRNDEAKLL